VRLLAAVALISIAAPTPVPTPLVDLGPRVTGASFDGVIVNSSLGEWTPSREQVDTLELLLPAYVKSQVKRVGRLEKPLFQYKRQYSGWLDQGKHLIIVTFFHRDTDIVKSGQWLRVLTTVAGGGDNFLSARYDAGSKAFLEFSINGPR
jgi:hypothetical protein